MKFGVMFANAGPGADPEFSITLAQLAKECATLDRPSRGRLPFGIGVGWLREEFDALGVPWEERGARAIPIHVGGHSISRFDVSPMGADLDTIRSKLGAFSEQLISASR